MNKIDVVRLMTDLVMDLNLQAMASAGLDPEDYKKQLQTVYPQIYSVNNEIFDLLMSKDLLKNVE